MRNIPHPHIEFTPYFEKRRKKAPLEIKGALRETLALFVDDPSHPSLRNHALKREYAGKRSIDITRDWRALFREEKNRIIFVEIGTHEYLYGHPKD